MISLLRFKVAGAVATVAALAATAFVVIPVPIVPYGIWLDSPRDGGTIAATRVTLTMHSDLDDLIGIQAVITRDGAEVATLTDNQLEKTSRGKDADTLYWYAQDWNAVPGDYELHLKSCTLDGPCWTDVRTTTLTVLEADPAKVDVATATPTVQPTADPTPSATPTPTPTPTATPSPEATAPPAPAPEPTPQPTTPPVEYEMPYGFIRQTFTVPTRLSSFFTIRGAYPQQAVGSVQVQVQGYQEPAVESAWTSIPCTGPLQPDPEATDRFTCTTGTYTIEPSAVGQRTGYYRVVLTNGDKTYVGFLQYFTLTR